MKIAIVGSEEEHWDVYTIPIAKAVIKELIKTWKETLYSRNSFISGGCPKGGVDIWAQDEFEQQKVDYLIIKPRVNKWSGKGGYMERNLEIAREADMVIDIEPKGRKSGGYWTMKQAEKMGKITDLIEI